MADLVISSTARARLRTAGRRVATREARAGWALSAPAIILMAALLILPALAVLTLSVTDWQMGAPAMNFVGLGNYADLLGDRTFLKSAGNTALYTLWVAPASVVLGLAAAMAIEAEFRGRTFFRAAYFMPVVSLTVAMATVWQYLLHPTIGPVNALFRLVGLAGPNWLASSDTVLLSLALIGIWQQVGFNMVLFLAGLMAIPRDLYAAAEVDGVRGSIDRFRIVTWPLLAPTTLFVVTISVVNAVKVFETVATLTRGEPDRSSEVLLWTIYQEGFVFLNVGYASAMAVIFVAVLLVITLVQTLALERRVHY